MADDDDSELKRTIEALSEREREVLRKRFGIDISKDISIEDVERQFQITRERIREIEERAKKKLARDAYQVHTPRVPMTMYWVEIALLAASILTPIIAWFVWRDGVILARSGSIMVFFAVVAEFFKLNKANRKHLLNAARARVGEAPWDFSRSATLVGLASLVCAAIGTLLWGFGDTLVG